jgi:hypothetical protein
MFDSSEKSGDWEDQQGLVGRLQYPNMLGRAEQMFNYVLRKYDEATEEHFYDTNSMGEMHWILARPDAFPPVDLLKPCTCQKASSPARSSLLRVLATPELADHILDYLVDISEHDLATGILDMSSFEEDPQMVTQVSMTILGLMLVNRWTFHLVACERQGLFLRVARLYGWMLPATARDWAAWSGLSKIDVSPDTALDWRGYLLKHLREETPHIRSRRRIYNMITQCVRGNDDAGNSAWRVGTLGYRPGFSAPLTWEWELTEAEEGTDVEPEHKASGLEESVGTDDEIDHSAE